jgi:hypothetical protein
MDLYEPIENPFRIGIAQPFINLIEVFAVLENQFIERKIETPSDPVVFEC